MESDYDMLQGVGSSSALGEPSSAMQMRPSEPEYAEFDGDVVEDAYDGLVGGHRMYRVGERGAGAHAHGSSGAANPSANDLSGDFGGFTETDSGEFDI